MNECTTWVRRSVCVAVLLAAAGLHGCGAEDGPEDSAQDAGQDAPADDHFRPAHVLASDKRQPEDVLSSFSPELSRDLSRGWGPKQFREAYNVPDTQYGKPAGYGIKVAIIVAYHYSNLQSDLNKFCQHFGLRPITLMIINQAGNVRNNAWALEASLNVQMVNAVAPGATVYVIAAKSESPDDIKTAIRTALSLSVNIVSMSFGAHETGSEDFGATFSPEANVVWIAASGDSGKPSFPATHPGVIAVGGTSLSSVDPFVETAWVDAGAGMSMVAEMPGFQMIPSVQERNITAYRSVPDVAFNADPEYGAQIYNSILGGWFVVGGTSVSTAFFAGVVALANQSKRHNNKPLLTSTGDKGVLLQHSLYQLMSTNGGPTNSTVLNDVVDGIAGEGEYAAGPGYDIATGLGSLNVQQFLDYMDAQ